MIGSDKIDLEINVSGAEKGRRDIDKFAGSVEKAGKKSRVAKSGLKDLFGAGGQLGETMEVLSHTTTAVGGALSAVGKLARSAAAGVQFLGEQLHSLGMRGGEVSAVAIAFERMTAPSLLTDLRDVTGGLVSNFDLMREASQAMRANLQSEDEITRWYAAVTQGAQDVGESIESMSRGLGQMLSGGGVEEVLGKLGVPFDGVRQRVRRAGESMETMRGKSMAMSMALELLEEDLEGTAEGVSNINDSWTALSVTTGNYYDDFARGFSENERLLGFFVDLAEGIDGVDGKFDDLGDTLANNTAGVLEWGVGFLASVREIAGGMSDISRDWYELNAAMYRIAGFSDYADQTQALADAAGAEGARLRQSAGGLRAGIERREAEEVRRQWEETHRHGGVMSPERRGAIEEMQRDIERAGYGGGRSGGRGREDPSFAALLVADLEEAGRAAAEARGPIMSLFEEIAAAAEVDIEADEAWHESEQERIALLSERAGIELELMQAANEQREKELDLLAMVADKEQDLADQRQENFDRGFDDTVKFVDGMMTVADAVANVFDTLSNSEGVSEADAKRYKKIKGGVLAGISFVQSAVEYAAAISDFANQKYGDGALHIASGIAYDVAGALALSQLGGSASRGAGAGAAVQGSYTPDRREETERTSGGGGTQIVLYTMGQGSARLGRELREADWQLERSGMDAPMAGAGGYG